jgi:hypothetical protein
MARAEELMAAQMSTAVSADYFDRSIGALDQPGCAPTLANAARRAARHPRIADW